MDIKKEKDGTITFTNVTITQVDAISAAIYGLYSQEQATDIMKGYQRRFQKICLDIYLSTELARYRGIIPV